MSFLINKKKVKYGIKDKSIQEYSALGNKKLKLAVLCCPLLVDSI